MKIKIEPKCKNGWPQYISSQGQWFPCWFVSHAHRHWASDFFVVHADRFDLNQRTLNEILRDPILQELEERWASGHAERIPFKCREFCGASVKPDGSD
jgi:hypothetical protein